MSKHSLDLPVGRAQSVQWARQVAQWLREEPCSIAQAARHLGLRRETLSHWLRILTLPPPVLQMVEQGWLPLAKAKLLPALPPEQQLVLAQQIASRQVSVRQAEARVRRAKGDALTAPVQHWLEETLGAPVALRSTQGAVWLQVRFADLEAFEGLLDRLGYPRSD